VNFDARVLFNEGERAALRGDHADARRAFLEAGSSAAAVQLWRTAIRCYRHALELDLSDREAVNRICRMPARIVNDRGWYDYRRALLKPSPWGPFGCRIAQVVSSDQGTLVQCPNTGPVLQVVMAEADLVEVHPHPNFLRMPIAMAMVVLRRGLWPTPRETTPAPMTVRVSFERRLRLRLDEHGDWEPLRDGSIQL
jgi:hypothetical protein